MIIVILWSLGIGCLLGFIAAVIETAKEQNKKRV